MYTIDVLENLEIQLGEIDYLMEEICKDPRIDLKKKELMYMENVRDCIKTALTSARVVMQKTFKK